MHLLVCLHSDSLNLVFMLSQLLLCLELLLFLSCDLRMKELCALFLELVGSRTRCFALVPVVLNLKALHFLLHLSNRNRQSVHSGRVLSCQPLQPRAHLLRKGTGLEPEVVLILVMGYGKQLFMMRFASRF